MWSTAVSCSVTITSSDTEGVVIADKRGPPDKKSKYGVAEARRVGLSTVKQQQ